MAEKDWQHFAGATGENALSKWQANRNGGGEGAAEMSAEDAAWDRSFAAAGVTPKSPEEAREDRAAQMRGGGFRKPA